MGVNNLLEIFDEKYYRNLNGGILEAFGILFSRDLKLYLYPWMDKEKVLNSENAPIHPRLRPLYDYLLSNKRIMDIEDYNEDVLNIHSRKCLEMIKEGKSGWESMVPAYVDTIIKDKKLFGYGKAKAEQDKPEVASN